MWRRCRSLGAGAALRAGRQVAPLTRRAGRVALLILVMSVLAVLVFGFAAAIYLGLALTFAALVIMVLLCQGEPADESQT